MARELEALSKQLPNKGPQNDDELHRWIKDNLNYDIPREPCCEGHSSPFQFLSDIYFGRVTAAVAMASRGGSKTMISAVIHLLNSLYKPGCESLTVGALDLQSAKAYETFRHVLKLHGKVYEPEDHPEVVRSVEKKTEFRSGSIVFIIPGTIAAVNGPHPQYVHTDEVELMNPIAFQESRNMSQSKDGYKKADWITSTRKGAYGPMQKILDAIAEAEREDYEPPYKLYVWCVFDVAKTVPNCQTAYPDLPDNEKCNCHRIVKGKWEDGSLRRFSDVCKGRLARSNGYMELTDIHGKFMENDQDTWEAQQECLKPEMGGMVFPTWSVDRYGIKWYEPDPSNGLIFMSVDYSGGATPHAVTWYQTLRNRVLVHGVHDLEDKPTKWLEIGTRVAFDEIYISNIANHQLADMIIKKEEAWKAKFPDFRVAKRFPDPANLQARRDFAAHNPPLQTVWYVTRDIKEQIKTCRQLLREDLFACDITRCLMMPKEFEAYHYPEKKPNQIDDPEIPVDDFNHIMSNFRYAMENIKHLERRMVKPAPGHAAMINRRGNAKSPIKSGTPRYTPINQLQ